MSIDLQKLDLRKKMVFDLSKKKGIENQKAQIVLCMDYSGSMGHLYRSEFVQDVLERIVPVAMQFDDNQELELYLFQNKCFKHKNNVTVKNVSGIIDREIYNKYDMAGTSYAPPINQIVKENAGSKGFLGLGGSKGPMDLPVYVIFITDGENDDRREAEAAIREASKFGIFFQFIGIGNQEFTFLDKLDHLSGRLLDNANFFPIQDLSKMSDQDLYEKLLGEFPDWLPLAKQHNLIK